MIQRLMLGIVSVGVFFVSSFTTVSVFAGSPPIAGARSGARSEGAGAIRSQTSPSSLAFPQEVTTAFTASPTTGGLGDALAASRSTFSTAERIEFDAVLFESGLAGSVADLQLLVFDATGGRHLATFTPPSVFAPGDRTGFFIQVDGGSLPLGQLKWVMGIVDASGRLFVTPFQIIEIQ
ncbi:MAG: hypothetical protein KGL31_02865 [candidate division NC10 bacterium]|nr:hypothetical protein [candidate division NC10 bacterium]MDE2320849.1 hypothetical protein [candidate division NC10 bacterium]